MDTLKRLNLVMHLEDEDGVEKENRHKAIIKSDEIDLIALWEVLWKDKLVISLITFIFSVLGLLYALAKPNIYQAGAELYPVSSDSGSSPIAGKFQGLANLAGVSLAGGGADKSVVALEIIQSRKFAKNFLTKYEFYPQLMAIKRWDSEKGRIIYNEDVYSSRGKQWYGKDGRVLNGPSEWLTFERYKKTIEVATNPESGVVVILARHQSPEFAKILVDSLVVELNSVMRQRDIDEASRSIEFLTEQLNEVSLSETRNMFYSLIEEQTKKIMLAKARPEYVFTIIDPPVVPEEKLAPNRTIICVTIAFLGGILSVCFVLARAAFYR